MFLVTLDHSSVTQKLCHPAATARTSEKEVLAAAASVQCGKTWVRSRNVLGAEYNLTRVSNCSRRLGSGSRQLLAAWRDSWGDPPAPLSATCAGTGA